MDYDNWRLLCVVLCMCHTLDKSIVFPLRVHVDISADLIRFACVTNAQRICSLCILYTLDILDVLFHHVHMMDMQ